ncbi:MAG: cobyrinate a,c-diamide synthase [bacterium]
MISSPFAVLFSSDRSSSGKSTFTLAFSRFMKERNIHISLFKIGPDFIDPIVLGAACKCNVANLDSFLIPKNRLSNLFINDDDNNNNNDDDSGNKIIKTSFIIEGAMGLYDGNSYIIAERFKPPVVLIMDARRISSTMASLIYGLKNYKKGIIISGVILNNISSERHYQIIAAEIKKNIKDIKVFGYISADDKNISIKERHLGLSTPGYFSCYKEFEEKVDKIKIAVMKNINIDLLIKTLIKDSKTFFAILKTNEKNNFYYRNKNKETISNRSKKIKIAVAYDNAFLFYYKFNFDIFKKFNAEIIFFSPIKDKAIPEGIKAIYIGGGYPELYAENLAENINLKKEIYKFYKNNGLIFAECGGLMYLSKKLIYKSQKYDFLDILPFISTMDGTKLTLGYRTVYLSKDSFLGEENLKINGHEFHYSKLLLNNDQENDNDYRYENKYNSKYDDDNNNNRKYNNNDNSNKYANKYDNNNLNNINNFNEIKKNKNINDNQSIIDYNITSDNKISNAINDGGNNFNIKSLSNLNIESVFAVKNVSSDNLTAPKINEGYKTLNAIGTYVHISFFSNQKIAKNFIESARKLSL